MKKILTGPLPVPSQVGDAAIAAGAVVLLRDAHPSAEITGWSTDVDVRDRRVVEDFVRTYGVDRVIYSPPSLSASAHHGRLPDLLSTISKYALPPASRMLGRRALRAPLGPLREIAEAIAEADLVVMRGGGYLSSPHIACDLWGLRLNSLSEVTIARALGVPYAIWGHTIWDLNGPLSKRILWPIIRDSEVTVCREQRSYDYLIASGAPAEKLTVLPDTAFALRPADNARVDQIMRQEGLQDIDAPLVGVNVRPPWDVKADYAELTERYLKAVAAAIDRLHEQYGTHVVLISHCHSNALHRVPDFQNERELQRELARGVRTFDAVHVLSGEYTPSELVGIYVRFQLMMTTRLHAGILSAVAGTPGVLVAYEKNKTYGIASMIGVARFVIDIETISEANLTDLAERLWAERGDVASALHRRMAAIREQMRAYSEMTLRGNRLILRRHL